MAADTVVPAIVVINFILFIRQKKAPVHRSLFLFVCFSILVFFRRIELLKFLRYGAQESGAEGTVHDAVIV